MKISIFKNAEDANLSAADLLVKWLASAKNFMPAAGNTPLELYRLVAEKRLDLKHLNVFILDEYVGVPKTEPRNCANLLRGSIQIAWGIPAEQFHTVSSEEREALASVLAHEKKIETAGGLDVVVLGLGQNGHLGFNEPGSSEHSTARVLDLEAISVEANRLWFHGKYAPHQGVTVGLKTILAAKKILIMAYGPLKTQAAWEMVKGPRSEKCPASFLQGLPQVEVFLDDKAAEKLQQG